MARRTSMGGPRAGMPVSATPVADTVKPATELDAIQADSEQQALPQQEKLFRIAPRVRSKLHNLPDPTKPPLGFVPGRGFDVVFPFIKLPHLAPDLNGDWVQFGSPELEPNCLYYGDNLQVLRTLSSNSIDLIYIDPPFFSGAEYNVIWGDTNEVRTFSDIWEGGLDTYLIWLNARLWEMRRALKETGSIYVHCDWHASHYIKAEMDKIFGYENFRSEIVWKRSSAHSDTKQGRKQPGNIHDAIFFYTKGSDWTWNPEYSDYEEDYIEQEYRHETPDGKNYKETDLTAAKPGGDTLFEWRVKRSQHPGARWDADLEDEYQNPRPGWHYKSVKPYSGRYWAFSKDNMVGFARAGKLIHRSTGMPRLMQFVAEMPGISLQDMWMDIPPVPAKSDERIGYPTQKPESLLKRIVLAGSPPNGTVADFFCGGGVTPAVAQQLGRRWIACDSSRIAVSVTLNRLVRLGEERSGVTSNFATPGQLQAKMDLPTPESALPDIRVHYVGVYPRDRFKAVDQREFERFILGCLAAQSDNSDSPITGWRSGREPLRVGPADPDASPDPKDVQGFFEAVLRHLQDNVRTVARYVCWRTSPELVTYRKRLSEYVRRNVQPRGTDLDFDFLLIDSEEFRERIRAKYPDADDNEFLLRFTKEPVIGEIAATRKATRAYRFEARDADSTNAGGYLVNCQWDFDYQRGHFSANRDHVLGRTELKGKESKAAGRKYEAALTAEHVFEKPGAHTIACRVQDNLGAEVIRTLTFEVN